MLRFARAALPKNDFVAADARAFSLASHFQGALSTFDSLNHLLSSDALTLAFRNVHAALRPGGLFLFDLNMEEAYRSEWGKASSIMEEDHLCIVQGGYDSTRRIGRTEITLFHRADLWQRAEITLLQKCHSPEEVRLALTVSGFGEIFQHDAETLGVIGEIGVGRAFFLAIKPLARSG